MQPRSLKLSKFSVSSVSEAAHRGRRAGAEHHWLGLLAEFLGFGEELPLGEDMGRICKGEERIWGGFDYPSERIDPDNSGPVDPGDSDDRCGRKEIRPTRLDGQAQVGASNQLPKYRLDVDAWCRTLLMPPLDAPS